MDPKAIKDTLNAIGLGTGILAIAVTVGIIFFAYKTYQEAHLTHLRIKLAQRDLESSKPVTQTS